MSRVVSTRAGLAVVLLLAVVAAVAVLQRPVVGREPREQAETSSRLAPHELLALLEAAVSLEDSTAQAARERLQDAGFSEADVQEGV